MAVVEAVREPKALIEIFDRHESELVSGTDEHRNVIRTTDRRAVAGARIQIEPGQ